MSQANVENTVEGFLLKFQIPYIETSAKDPPLNVDAAFHEVVRVIRFVNQYQHFNRALKSHETFMFV